MMNPIKAMKIARITADIDKHLVKKCAYCDEFFDNTRQVIEFVEHLKSSHIDIINSKEIEEFRRIISRL